MKRQRFGLTTDRTASNPAYLTLLRDNWDSINNTLIVNVLHASVGAGFIPALPATSKN